ncbi:hypothetical protein LR48_Vigan01g092600 [Vigna angularis]|nr:hypothetical protein LR48_Vigan01g092600 [Vigna angularis]
MRTNKDSFGGRHNPTSGAGLRPSHASCPRSSHQLGFDSDLKSSRTSPSMLPWLKEKPVVPKGNPTNECEASTPIGSSFLNPLKSGCVHSDLELNMVQKSHLCAFDLNGKLQTPKVVQSLSIDHRRNLNVLPPSSIDDGASTTKLEGSSPIIGL